MPTYSFENINTGEHIDIELKISELDNYKKDHPELQQMFTKMAILDPIKLGITKPPQDFQREVLGRIKKSNPGSQIGTRRWDVPNP